MALVVYHYYAEFWGFGLLDKKKTELPISKVLLVAAAVVVVVLVVL